MRTLLARNPQENRARLEQFRYHPRGVYGCTRTETILKTDERKIHLENRSAGNSPRNQRAGMRTEFSSKATGLRSRSTGRLGAGRKAGSALLAGRGVTTSQPSDAVTVTMSPVAVETGIAPSAMNCALNTMPRACRGKATSGCSCGFESARDANLRRRARADRRRRGLRLAVGTKSTVCHDKR